MYEYVRMYKCKQNNTHKKETNTITDTHTYIESFLLTSNISERGWNIILLRVSRRQSSNDKVVKTAS